MTRHAISRLRAPLEVVFVLPPKPIPKIHLMIMTEGMYPTPFCPPPPYPHSDISSIVIIPV